MICSLLGSKAHCRGRGSSTRSTTTTSCYVAPSCGTLTGKKDLIVVLFIIQAWLFESRSSSTWFISWHFSSSFLCLVLMGFAAQEFHYCYLFYNNFLNYLWGLCYRKYLLLLAHYFREPMHPQALIKCCCPKSIYFILYPPSEWILCIRPKAQARLFMKKDISKFTLFLQIQCTLSLVCP